MATSALRPAGFFVVRTPLLPFDTLRDWGANLEAPLASASKDGAVLGRAIGNDRNRLRERLQSLLQSPVVREAIYVASPSLYERLPRWLEQPDSKEGQKVEHVLVRYIGRMSSRPTPFGLFAAVTVGRVADRTEMKVEEGGTRHVRLDMEYLVRLGENLERTSNVGAVLRLRPNRALYRVGGRIHYPALHAAGGARAYRLEAVEPDEALERALDAARAGAMRDEIAARLVEDGASLEDARTYVDELVDNQVLQTELRPPLTGRDPVAAMLSELTGGDDEEEVVRAREQLARAMAELTELEREPLGVTPDRYQRIASSLEPFGVKANPAHIFQVDMSRRGTATLASGDVDAIAQGIEALRVFAQPENRLASFISAFVARYERREVPLMEALDEEFGIGFEDSRNRSAHQVPLVAGLPLGEVSAADERPWDAKTRFLARRLERVWSDGSDVLTLEPADLADLAKASHRVPASVAALVSVFGPHGSGSRPDRRFFVHGYTGASAARLLGRFSFWSSELTELLRAHLREEERTRPEAVFAEVVHLPVGPRVGNVLLRAVLRDHEIAFCARPGVPDECVIPLSDLSICVRGGAIVLRSARLDREVVPRISNAHNYLPNNLGAYRFLAALQGQGAAAGGSWDWGGFSGAAFLPRVEVGSVILSLRKWSLAKKELEELAQTDAVRRFRAFRAVCEARRMPRFIGLQDGDNILPVDLDNVLSVDAVAGILKRRTWARFVELLCEPTDLVTEGPGGGRYCSQIVIPLLWRSDDPKDRPQEAPPPTPPSPPRLRRQFAPGTEWLFAKVYCATASVDDVLRDCIRPVIASFSPRGIDRWFFLRYADPDNHLRVRFHGAPGTLLGSILPDLEQRLSSLMRTGTVSRVEVATYEREIERYGGDEGIELCERAFEADSEAALRVVEALGAGTERDRWRWSLLGVDRLLADIGLDLRARLRLADGQRRLFKAEAGTGVAGERAMGVRFRKERQALEAMLDEGDPRVNIALSERSVALGPVFAELRGRAERLTVRLDDLAASLVHMWNNRVLLTQARRHELVIHEFLSRLYESALARNRGGARG